MKTVIEKWLEKGSYAHDEKCRKPKP